LGGLVCSVSRVSVHAATLLAFAWATMTDGSWNPPDLIAKMRATRNPGLLGAATLRCLRWTPRTWSGLCRR